MTCDKWQLTFYMWHMTCDRYGDVDLLSLALTAWEWRFVEGIFTKDHWMIQLINQLITKVFVEQPRLHWVCALLFIVSSRPGRVVPRREHPSTYDKQTIAPYGLNRPRGRFSKSSAIIWSTRWQSNKYFILQGLLYSLCSIHFEFLKILRLYSLY